MSPRTFITSTLIELLLKNNKFQELHHSVQGHMHNHYLLRMHPKSSTLKNLINYLNSQRKQKQHSDINKTAITSQNQSLSYAQHQMSTITTCDQDSIE